MKKTWINILKIALKTVLAACLFIAVWDFLTPYFRLDRNKDGDCFRNLPHNVIDVLALGSSHMQYAFDPGQYYAYSGQYAYVMGSSCQPFSTSYYMLKEALKTQHPSVVLVDVFTLLPQSQVCYANGMYYKAIDMMSGENRRKAAENAIPVNDEISEEDKESYTFDLLMNHDNWKRMDFSDPKSIIENAKPAEDYLWDLGYVRQDPLIHRYTPVETYQVSKTVELSEDEKKWIDAFIDLCKKEQIHLLFIKTPYLINQADTDKLSAIWNYLDQKNADYIDFADHTADYQWFMDMDGDTWHNNSWGAEIITKALSDYINDKSWVKDHHQDDTFDTLVQGSQRIAAHELMGPANINIYRLLSEAAYYPCITVLRSKAALSSSITESENKMIADLGFHHDYVNDNTKDYYGVVVNHQLLKESNEPFDISIGDVNIHLDQNGTTINGVNYDQTDSEFEITFMSSDLWWINPIPIDYSSQMFWKKGCDSWTCSFETGKD